MTLLYLFVMSVFTFLLYAYDKKLAQKGAWRISEFALLFWTALGGAMGALLSMYIFHHKTQKAPFVKGVPFLIVIQTLLIIIIANIFL